MIFLLFSKAIYMNLILIRFPLIGISHYFTANILSVSVVILFVIYHVDAHFKADKIILTRFFILVMNYFNNIKCSVDRQLNWSYVTSNI